MGAPKLLVAQDKITAQWLNFATTRTNAKLSWTNSTLFPSYASVASAGLLILYVLYLQLSKLMARRHSYTALHDNHQGLFARAKSHVTGHGGSIIFAFEIVRLIGCATLTFLSSTLFLSESKSNPKPEGGILSSGLEDIAAIALSLSFAYYTILALGVVTLSTGFVRSILQLNLTLLLLITWVVYAVRDLAPLCTYTGRPVDKAESPFFWGLIIDLTIVAIILPLLQPRQYVPVDPSDPKPANPRQTAAPLSILLFTWLDPLVWHANRVERVPLSDLPPLSDSDNAKVVARKAFVNIDPMYGEVPSPKRRYIFWGLLRTFKKDYFLIALTMLLQAVSALLSPYALKNLLIFIETKGEDAQVKPWVWVILLFLAPFTSSIFTQQYYSLYTRVMVQLEAVLTQLVLEHSLRIRMVAEADSETTQSGTPASTTKPPVIEAIENEAEEETVAGSSASSATTVVDSPGASIVPQESKAKNLVGRMNNLISSDLKTIGTAAEFMQPLFLGPILIAGCIFFLYTILGWSAFVGLAGMIIQLPVPIWLSKMLQSTTRAVTQKTDARVDAVTETMSVVRMIKLFGWEKKMSTQLDQKREEELRWVWKSRMYSMAVNNVNFILPAITMSLTFAAYSIIIKRPFDAATVFSALTVFDILRGQVHRTFYFVPAVIKGKVSLDRIDDFLNTTELLDQYTETELPVTSTASDSHDIGFRAAKFSWSVETDSGALTPSKRRFRLHIENELLFKRGKINLIVGPTGSGKTSMLMALLGEMHFLPYEPNSWFNLPRDAGVAYAAQESWVLNDTIRGNIVFGAPFDQDRYKKVLYQCGLTRDLTLFAAGDNTEVGEKGLTLSGGQKARVTLARAVYSSAEVVILDDVLAALDVHTAKWIVEKCFLGDLINGRTLILVTHNVSLAGPHADFVVSLSSDGRVKSQGSFSQVLAQDDKLQREMVKAEQQVAAAEEVIDEENPDKKDADGKLVVEEESGVGHLSLASLKMYFAAFGGRWPTLFWIAFWSATFFECTIEIGQPWFLGQWATEYEHLPPDQVDVAYYLGGYVFLVALMLVIFAIAQIGLALGTVSSARTLHRRLVDNVLGSTLRWLDKTPTSRVTTRCTQDIAAIDSMIPDILSGLFELTVLLIVRFIAIFYLTPIFGLMGFGILLVGLLVGHLYIKAQLSVKREQDKAKAPVMGHFQSTIEGIISVRAYGAQAAFKLKSMQTIDSYSRAALLNWDLNRWIAIRVDALGNIFSSCLAAYFVYGSSSVGAANSGFSLNMAVAFGTFVLYWVRMANMFEVQGNSIERLYQYMIIEQEPKPTPEGVPPAYWPSSGNLRVEKLSARYSENGPKVLHDLSFEVKSGERVGIVGRTGSGKSSLTLSLLRCIITGGNVFYDDIRTSSVNLDALRSHITIIPQIPELLSGSLRKNLDPFDQHDDATLNSALRSAGLFSLQSEDDESRMTLDSAIARGGGNLSVGQRQIIALARAMVRESKLLILDEATSAIDYNTDAIIQKSLRTELKKDVTILTVAHRLQTIMDSDKIMVLDTGRIVEFDSPKELLKNPSGFLRSLVDESGDKEALYAAAGATL